LRLKAVTQHVMRCTHSTVLAVMLLSGCTTPPARAPQLAELLNTNGPCRVRLQPAWKGEGNYTVRTGFFTNAEPPKLERLNRELRFDWFSYSETPSPFNFGAKTVSKAGRGQNHSNIHTFRASLPTDAEIGAAETVSALEKFLGPAHGFTDGWGSDAEMHSTAGWSFFALADTDTIETVSIFCMVTQRRGDVERRVDSVRVIRGRAEQKAR
jgi:hypothetical protein